MKNLRKFAAIIATAGLFIATSCGDDDPDIILPTGGGPDPEPTNTVLNGDISEDITLDASNIYSLTGTLTVQPGAKLTIPAGTTIVSQTGTDKYVVVQKGAQIDIQGTASNPVVMGTSNNNPGDWGGLVIAGDATTTEGANAVAEVGGILYGGTNDADNSGSINYLIIRGAGAQINADSQYNGLTLYAVGSGTSINNVAIIDGADDGVEFFGGTVSASNLYFENNEDDSVDWTEGWNGTIANVYVSHSADFSTAIEADGINNNPRVVNFTAVSSVSGTALQFKKESGATITGLSLTGYGITIDMKDDGPLANVQIDGVNADPSNGYLAAATVSLSDFSWATDNTQDTDVLPAAIDSDLTLNASLTYLVEGTVSLSAGARLTIPAGTQIISGTGTDKYIVVQKGAKIDIQGTETSPVVMKSAAGNPGDWGGLVIAGNATTTEGTDAIAEVGGILYGGTNDSDNSGSINYLVIRGAGAQINADSQYNGLTLYAVGSGTTVSNVAILNGADDGVEFFGGTVSATNLYFENNEDDSIDWTEGWNGTITNVLVRHTVDGFSTTVEADGINGNPTIVNFTAESTVGGTALQFKKESGATITNILLTGYDINLDMKDNGPTTNVIVDGTPVASEDAAVYGDGTAVDLGDWFEN